MSVSRESIEPKQYFQSTLAFRRSLTRKSKSIENFRNRHFNPRLFSNLGKVLGEMTGIYVSTETKLLYSHVCTHQIGSAKNYFLIILWIDLEFFTQLPIILAEIFLIYQDSNTESRFSRVQFLIGLYQDILLQTGISRIIKFYQ
jgi:hypothetical protein